MWAWLEGNKYLSKVKMSFVLDVLSQRCLQDILEEWSSVKLSMCLELKTEVHASDKYLV